MRPALDGGGCFPTGRHYPGIAHLLRVVAAGLADEFSGEHAIQDLRLVAIDTETTGRDPENDRIVEIGCVVWQAGEIVLQKSWLINPGCPIPQEAFEVHQIGDEAVKDQPRFEELAHEVLAVLAGAVPLAYNAEFDRRFLAAELSRVARDEPRLPPAVRKGIEWIDPLVWARELHRMEKGKSLAEVCERMGIAVERSHRAADDAEAVLKVFTAFNSDTRVPKTYAAFIREQRRLARLFDDERVGWRPRDWGALTNAT